MHVATAVLLAACSSAVFGADSNIFGSEPVFAPTCPGNTCPAGFTGRYCDQVLCDKKGTVPPPPTSGGFGIDMVPMSKCASTIAVPVDSHVTTLFLSVDGTDMTSMPSIVLKTASGTVMPSTSTIISNNRTLSLSYASPAAGVYYATVAASTGCTYKANALTKFSAAVGFTYGPRATHMDMPSSTLTEFQLATMVVAFRNLPAPGYAHKAEVYAQELLQASYRVNNRYNCAYYQFVGPISCDSNKNWYFKLHGIDENGFAFMRTSVFPCVGGGGLTTTANPLTTTANPGGCLHGGVQDPANPGKCVCEFDWIGPKCATAVCFNGGTPQTDGTVCKCSTGYGGFHCDATICAAKNPSPPYTGTELVLGIVIQATTSMASVIQGLKNYVPELIETFNQQHPKYIKRYMIVSYDDMGATLLSSAHDPLITIGHIEQLKLKSGTVKCKKMLNQALNKALTLPGTAPFPKFSSTYVFTDSPVDLTDVHTSLAAINSLEVSKNKLSIFYTPAPACQALNSPEVKRLFDLAEFTGGQMYYTKAATTKMGFQLSNVMTTSYLNARVFDRFDPRCDVKRTAYVPIDSHTAAFTFSVAGNQPSVVVQDPTGALWPTVPIVDDQLVQVQQAVSPCPTGWNQFDNFCFMGTEITPLGWNAAQTKCRQAGGTLGNVMNAQRQAFLDRTTNGIDYLIGLNDQRFHGTYVWDSMADPAIPLLAASYRNWAKAAGEPVVGNGYCTAVRHKAGVMNGTGMWYKVDCNTPMSYICQKPALNFYNNGLPAGIWKIDYQTRIVNGSEYGTSCLAKVDVQSTLQANWAFTTKPGGQFNDNGVPEPSAKSKHNRVIASVIGLKADSYVAQVQFFKSGSGPLIVSSPLMSRIGCLFGFYSNEFMCPKNAFGLEITGHDEKGYTFSRQGYAICIGAPSDLTEEMITGAHPMKF